MDKKNKQIILGIETSCDETAAAIVANGRRVYSNIISSQIDIHKKFGGVVPEIASRKHLESIGYVTDLALSEAGMSFSDIDALAVTYGPGLVGALLVGVSYAKSLAYALNKPLLAVNHIEGHISANYLEDDDFEPPFICLVVSGGHTHIMHIRSHDQFEVLGRTHDDAAGEAFDKVARAIGLGYPGGPAIDMLAKSGDPDAFALPTAFDEKGNYDFSFSGLKSAVLNLLNKASMKGGSVNTADLAASFQQTVVNILVKKAVSACKAYKLNRLALAGGVSCNSALREAVAAAGIKNGLEIKIPSPVFCTDNAAMIAARAFYSNASEAGGYLYLNACPGL